MKSRWCEQSPGLGPPSSLWLPLIVLATLLAATNSLHAPSRPKSRKAGAIADDIFAGTNVLRMQITIPQSGMNALRHTGWGNGRERPIAMATVEEDGVVYTNVAVHLKGSAGSFRSIDENPCLTLNFEKFATNQTFHGLHKLSLNNSAQDRSYLNEKISRELFESAGVPVPRAGHALVQLNGRNIGLHVLTEGFGKQFLKRYFKNTKGNLYDGGFVREVTDSLSVNSGDDPENNSGLRALARAIRANPTNRMEQLKKTLDMDRFLSYLAMDVIQCNWDGYAMNHNNWRIFHDLDSNKMVFMPHGLDQMFGVQRATPDYPILPHMQGKVAAAVVSTPEGRSRYLARLSELYTNVFHVDALLRRIDELAAVINPVIAEYSPERARRHEIEVENFKRRITMRDESLSRQLLGTVAESAFDSNGAMALKGWKKSTRTGEPAFREAKAPDGTNAALLYIGAPNGSVSASWRTSVKLDEGSYRFEGKIKTTSLKSDAEGGAGARLRISRGTGPRGLSGNTDWQNVAYSFEVSESGTDVELVCELRASRGEACFDAASLRLIKVE